MSDAISRRPWRRYPLGVFVLLMLLACGQATAIGGAATATATATPIPTPTPVPGRLTVQVNPVQPSCGQSCTSFNCALNGPTCHTDAFCDGNQFPSVTLGNAGQAAVSWTSSTADLAGGGANHPAIAPTGGSISGGGHTNVAVTVGDVYFNVKFTSNGATATIEIFCPVG